MKRRELLSLLGGAVAWPLAARAQKEDRKRLAIVMNLPEHDLEAQHGSQALVLKLRELGWLEGRNLDLDFRWVADRVADLPGIVKEIASLKPDAIVGRSGVPQFVHAIAAPAQVSYCAQSGGNIPYRF